MSDGHSSSSFHKIKCKGCGAELKYLAGEPTVTCGYCGVVNSTGNQIGIQPKAPQGQQGQPGREPLQADQIREEIQSVVDSARSAVGYGRKIRTVLTLIVIVALLFNFLPGIINFAETQYLGWKSGQPADSTLSITDTTAVYTPEDQPPGDDFADEQSGLTGNPVDPLQVYGCLQAVLTGNPDVHPYIFNDSSNTLAMDHGITGEATQRLHADWIGHVMATGCYPGDFGDSWRDEGRKSFLQTISGIEPFSEQRVRSSEALMNFVNPEFLVWIRMQLILSPDTQVGGVSVQSIYDNVFRKQIRTLAKASQVLGNGFDASDIYYDEVVVKNKWVIDYLRENYAISTEDTHFAGLDPDYFPLYAGFWIRRQLDGSYAEAKNLVMEVVTTYDKQWACDSNYLPDLCSQGAR